tara:strand:- start:3397 stop:3855 length:459 start_codon:yes stop_codon:yes gene_type:complete
MKFNSPSTLLLSIFITLTSLLSSCQGGGEEHNHDEVNSDKSEAVEIHNASDSRAKDFEKSLVLQFRVTENTDSNFIKLAAIDARYLDWKTSMVKLPGTECNHAPGEEHHHDHAAEALLEELSDADLLTLQKDISSALDVIIADFNQLVLDVK